MVSSVSPICSIALMQLSALRLMPKPLLQVYDAPPLRVVVFVGFCHGKDGSKSVPFVEIYAREASVAFVGSSNNDVFVVFLFSSDDIGGSYTTCVVPKELRRRAKMAMMSTSMLDATDEWVQASRVFRSSFNRGEIWGSICGGSFTPHFAYREAEIHLVDICLTTA